MKTLATLIVLLQLALQGWVVVETVRRPRTTRSIAIFVAAVALAVRGVTLLTGMETPEILEEVPPGLRQFQQSTRQESRSSGCLHLPLGQWINSENRAAHLNVFSLRDVRQTCFPSLKERRMFLINALKDKGLVAHGYDGFNVWVPVTDEQKTTRRLLEKGWIVQPGAIFRLLTPMAIRVTTSALLENEARELAEIIHEIENDETVQRGA